MFGTLDCLIAAIKLIDLPRIAIDTDCTDVTYIHLLFDQHEVKTANGAPCESLHTGPEALKYIPATACAELFTIFTELMKRSCQRQLVAWHKKNKPPLPLKRRALSRPERRYASAPVLKGLE